MSIKEKLNDYLLKKVSKSKVKYLFAVSKEYLFNQVHELNEEIELLKEDKIALQKYIHNTQMEYNNTLVQYEDLQKQNNTLKTQIEAREDTKYKLAYERLVEKYDSLKSENKSINMTVDAISKVVENVSRQNTQLKEQNKIITTQNERLTAENKNYKDKEKVIEIKKENTAAVKHNFNKRVNTNSSSKSISLSR